MQGAPTECTRICTGRGSKYLLVVGEKLYSLNTEDKALLMMRGIVSAMEKHHRTQILDEALEAG